MLRFALWAGFLLVPNFFLAIALTEGDHLRELAANGRSTTGQVVGKSSHSRGRSGRTYRVQYQFQVDGKVYQGEDEANWSEYLAAAKGRPCAVTYLPEHPETHCLGPAGQRLQRWDDGYLLFALLSAVGLGGVLAWKEFALRRELRLARWGEAVVGHVTDRGSSRTRNGGRYWAGYRFASPVDDRASGRSYVSSSVWSYLRPPLPVTVLFDPERPRCSRLLCAFRNVQFLPEETAE
jgi:hypothetical protein